MASLLCNLFFQICNISVEGSKKYFLKKS
jgi:hypothetical protein